MRDNGGFFLGERETTLAERLKGAGIPDRRIRRRVRPRSQVGSGPGVRQVLRQFRSVEVPQRLAQQRRASGQRGGGSARSQWLDTRRRRRSSSPGCTSTTRTSPYRSARAVQIALCRSTLRRRNRVRGFAGRAPARLARRPRTSSTRPSSSSWATTARAWAITARAPTDSSSTRACCTCR